jgi:uncharacterized membrane protein YgcG
LGNSEATLQDYKKAVDAQENVFIYSEKYGGYIDLKHALSAAESVSEKGVPPVAVWLGGAFVECMQCSKYPGWPARDSGPFISKEHNFGFNWDWNSSSCYGEEDFRSNIFGFTFGSQLDPDKPFKEQFETFLKDAETYTGPAEQSFIYNSLSKDGDITPDDARNRLYIVATESYIGGLLDIEETPSFWFKPVESVSNLMGRMGRNLISEDPESFILEKYVLTTVAEGVSLFSTTSSSSSSSGYSGAGWTGSGGFEGGFTGGGGGGGGGGAD